MLSQFIWSLNCGRSFIFGGARSALVSQMPTVKVLLDSISIQKGMFYAMQCVPLV